LSGLASVEVIDMALITDHDVLSDRHYPWWRGPVLLLAAFAITLSLANRVFEGHFYAATSVASSAGHAKVQHRDSDAADSAPPIPKFAIAWTCEPMLLTERAYPARATGVYASLYNRPPPTA
jgi:hypothetical protein